MSILERIRSFHDGRDPERLAIKYQILAGSPFAFFRGTAQLFYEDLVKDVGQLPPSPKVWISGDAHMENFGVYKGDNRLVYFDYNDFDEAALAPATWELIRMLVSIALSIPKADQCRLLAEAFLTEYSMELATGKPRWVERATARDGVRDLVYSLKGRTRKQLLKRRTMLHGGSRAIRTDGEFALPLLPGEWESLREFLKDFADHNGRPDFFELLSAGRRIAGNGSLGVNRFILLVEGKGSPDKNYLLDLKQSHPSVIAAHIPQPEWPSQAHRIVSIQQRMQAIAPAFLHPVSLTGEPCVLRELVPREDRIRLSAFLDRPAVLQQILTTEGSVMAWAQLRSSGRQGSSNADGLIAFGADTTWHEPLIELANQYAKRITREQKEFRKATSSGLKKP